MGKNRPQDIGPQRRMAPRLRLASNGDFEVNPARSERSGSLSVSTGGDLRGRARLRTTEAIPLFANELPIRRQVKTLAAVPEMLARVANQNIRQNGGFQCTFRDQFI